MRFIYHMPQEHHINKALFFIVLLVNFFPPEISAHCFHIDRLQIKDATLLKTENSIKSAYEDRCLSAEDIKNVQRDITNEYIKNGYITSRVIIPDQDLKSKQLIIEVKEGRTEEVKYIGTSSRNHVLPTLKDQYLNLRDIEQATDQMNRLKSNNATVQISPGSKPFHSIVTIDNTPGKRWHLTTGIDNSGTKQKGIMQSFTNITLEDIFSSNEIYSFGHRRSLSNPHDRLTRSYSAVISVPYSYHNLNLTYDQGSYSSYIFANKQRFKNHGKSKVAKVSLESVIHRDGAGKTMTSFGISREDYSNYIADTRIEVSSYLLHKVDFVISHQHKLASSVLGVGAAYIHGVNENYMRGFGKSKTPHKRFDKFSYDLSWMKPLPITPAYVLPRYSLVIHGQYTPHILCGTEKIAIGGLNSVRGFKELIENADNGIFMRNELSFDLGPKSNSGMQLFLAYDLGRFKNYEEKGEAVGSMSGGAIGIRKNSGTLRFDLTLGKAFTAKYVKRSSMELYFSMSLSV